MRCLFCLESCRWHKNQSQSYPLTSTCAMTHVLAHTLITFYRNWFASSIDNELVTNIAYYVTGMNELSVSGWGGGLWMSGLWWDFFSCLFWDRVPLCSLDWSQTQRSLCLHLLGADIKGMGHHTSPLAVLTASSLLSEVGKELFSACSQQTVSPSLTQLGICLLSIGVHVTLPAPPQFGFSPLTNYCKQSLLLFVYPKTAV